VNSPERFRKDRRGTRIGRAAAANGGVVVRGYVDDGTSIPAAFKPAATGCLIIVQVYVQNDAGRLFVIIVASESLSRREQDGVVPMLLSALALPPSASRGHHPTTNTTLD